MADVITRTVDLGIVTAYAEAVEAGYTGTEEEFAEGLRKSADYANNAQASATEAERQAGLASDSATEASGYASDAEGYKDSASGYADDASGYASDAQGYAQDAQASAEQAEQTLNSYAKVDGFYEGMTVGTAEQLLSSVYLTDEAPYNFRTSGGALEIGNRETDEIIGGSVVWNQLVQTTDTSVTVPSGHKYYANINGVKTIGLSNGTAISINDGTKDNVVDLTAMFGSTIADYLYTLEQATAGSGVAKLKSWGFFLKDYYAYSEPTFKHVSGLTSHKMVGFNQFDKSTAIANTYINNTNGSAKSHTGDYCTDYIPVIPNVTYHITTEQTGGAWGAIYDSNKQYIEEWSYYTAGNPLKNKLMPSNAAYVRLTIYRNADGINKGNIDTFCLNFRYDGERDGEYEPYTVHTYALDDVTLRGIPKLDTDNNLYYDGDTYESDGTVTRNTILRAYQEGDESLANAITDGTNTVVYSANNATESADAYQNPQIVDNWGTEEYIGSEIPVGHSTKYSPDLKAKVEVAPNAPTNDGLYLMKRENGENSYIAYVSPLPSVSEDGTFVLKATKSGSTTTLSWVSE